jgi:uncharacterized protein YecE (DUF72 family)
MTRCPFIAMVNSSPEKFHFSVRVPGTITHNKKLDVDKGAITDFEEPLDKISQSKKANKLGALLIQLPLSFTVIDFKNIDGFLERLPNTNNYNYVVEFRHPSWKTEGPGEMLWHYNIGAVIADLPTRGKFGIFV